MADASSLDAERDSAGPFASPPRAERPQSPPASYGVPAEGGAFVPWEHVVDRLREAVGYWIGTVTRDGRPHVVPIWGVLIEGRLYLETGAPGTLKNRNLARNPRSWSTSTAWTTPS